MKSMMLIFAHPDDESFTCGGTVAQYARNGWDIHLVCATEGGAGRTGPYGKISSTDLKEVRRKELASAAKILGIKTIQQLEYTDGELKAVEAGELEDRFHKILTEYQPDIVITFEPRGISNHPDHVKISRAATFAFQKYARSVVAPRKRGSRDPHGYKAANRQGIAFGDRDKESPKLYHVCLPQSVVDHLISQDALPKDSFGKPFTGVDDKKITTVIDIEDAAQQKIDALLEHKTQEDDVRRFFQAPHHPLLSREFYVLRLDGITEVYLAKGDIVSNEL